MMTTTTTTVVNVALRLLCITATVVSRSLDLGGTPHSLDVSAPGTVPIVTTTVNSEPAHDRVNGAGDNDEGNSYVEGGGPFYAPHPHPHATGGGKSGMYDGDPDTNRDGGGGGLGIDGSLNQNFPQSSTSSLGTTSELVHDMVTPFFLVASILFILALVYSIIFLCIMRFGTFQPEYNARFFRGRIYFCVGSRFWSYICRCYIPICWCVRLHPVSEDQAFSRALEGGGLSKEERREALLDVLGPLCHTVDGRNLPQRADCNDSSSDRVGSAVGGRDLVLNITPDGQNEQQDLVSSNATDGSKDLPGECQASPNSPEDDEEVVDFGSSLGDDELMSLGYDPTCSICLNEYVEGETFVISSKCSHRFHRDCVLEWLEVHNNTACPNCRVDMISNEQVKDAAKRLRMERRQSEVGRWFRFSLKGKKLGWIFSFSRRLGNEQNSGEAVEERDDFVENGTSRSLAQHPYQQESSRHSIVEESTSGGRNADQLSSPVDDRNNVSVHSGIGEGPVTNYASTAGDETNTNMQNDAASLSSRSIAYSSSEEQHAQERSSN